MAISASDLNKLMLDLVTTNMKKIDPKAKPQKEQKAIIKAIAKGTIKVLKISIIPGAAPGTAATGIAGKGITIVDSLITQTAKLTMMGFTGGSLGKAFEPFVDGLAKALAQHLQKAEIVSISGFGGQGLPPVNFVEPVLTTAIIALLPTKLKSNMLSSPFGMFFIKSIATGFAASVSTGIPGIVPVTPTPTSGLLVGQIK